MTVNYREKVGDIAPNASGFSLEGGRAVYTYYVTSNEVIDAISEILGSSKPDTTGGITRVRPRACPQFPWLVASRIENIQGIGYRDNNNSTYAQKYPSTGAMECPLISDDFWSYPQYGLQVEYTARPYAMLADDEIGEESITWYNDDGAGQPTVNVKREWLRWVEWDYAPASEFLTFQQGSAYFVRYDIDIVRNNSPDLYPPHGFSFPGPQRIFIDKTRITATWKAVPFTYINHDNSYIRKWQGRVNQLDWMGCPKGSLLYVGYKVKRYLPPLPTKITEDSRPQLNMLCDVEFSFDYVKRTSKSDIEPEKKNWIAAGHNLQPFAGDKQFYYAIFPPADFTNLNSRSQWRPTYESAPFQLLFRDPSV